MVELALADFFNARYGGARDIEQTYEEAIRYAVEGGGKRLRPILTLLSYEHVSGGESRAILPCVIGIEFIHCFTLVHDDLPSMDNDEYRRGKLTVWKKY
jgi:geranylgeranyl pyrophosphate synthase